MRRFVLLAATIATLAWVSSARAEPTGTHEPDWAVPYGAEFWNETPASNGIDIGGVIERVTHAIETGRSSSPSVRARTYTAIFIDQGLLFTPPPTGQTKGSTATLKTVSVSRAGAELATRAGNKRTWQFRGNTAQTLLGESAGLVEHVQAHGSGIEVTWVLRKRPEGAGPLTIEVELDGAKHTRTSGSGLHFVGAGNRSRFRVSHAVAVDSAERRWPIALSYENQRVIARVPAAVVDNATYPLAIDPEISPEFGMDEPVPDTGGLPRTEPALASNGEIHLAVWTDQRNITDDNLYDIYGTRIDASTGSILDPEGLAICSSQGSQYRPAVASDGTDFLVAWSDLRDYEATEQDLYGARVRAQDGAVLDTDGIAISATEGKEREPELASDGTYYLLLWHTSSTDDDGVVLSLYGSLVDATGPPVLSGTTIYFSGGAAHEKNPSVASNGESFLVVWEDYPGNYDWPDKDSTDTATADEKIWGEIIFTASGDIASHEDFQIADAPSLDPTVASNGNGYIVSWSEAGSIMARRVSGSGLLLGSSAAQLVVENGSDPSASSDGVDYLVSWADGREYETSGLNIYAARVSGQNGTNMDPDGFAVCSSPHNQLYPESTHGAGEYLVVWEDGRNGVAGANQLGSIYGARVNASGPDILDPDGIAVAAGPNNQLSPAVASSGTDFMVVWEDSRNHAQSGFDVYGVRVDGESGEILEPSGIPIATSAGSQIHPAISSRGEDYLVVWAEADDTMSCDIRGRRIDAESGEFVDEFEFEICDAAGDQLAPEVESNGEDYLVAWQTMSMAAEENGLFAVRIEGSSGSQIGECAPIRIWPGYGTFVRIASDGTDYFVIWTESGQVLGNHLNSSNGELSTSNGFTVSEDGYAASVASNGSDYLVVHKHAEGLRAVRVSGSDPTTIDDSEFSISSLEPHSTGIPEVAFNGLEFLAVWESNSESPHQEGGTLRGARIHATELEVFEPGVFTIGDTERADYGTQTLDISTSGERFLVTYQTAQLGSERAMARFVDPGYCLIEENTYSEGALNPNDICEQCLPQLSEHEWSPRDCSYLDEQCIAGVCLVEAGGCTEIMLPAGTPCDDGDPETINDQCDAWGTCSGEAPGSPDGDPATTHDFRAGAGGCACDSSGATASVTSLLTLLLSL